MPLRTPNVSLSEDVILNWPPKPYWTSANAPGRWVATPQVSRSFMGQTIIAAATDQEAQARLEDYRRHVSAEGALSLLSGYLGIDLASSDLDAPLDSLEINAIRSMVDNFKRSDPTRTWTLRDMAERAGLGSKSPLVGSPKTIADAMTGWMEESGIDGFNISYLVSPGDLTAFVDLVVPELQRRGVYKTQYQEGTLREKLYGHGRNRLPPDHPGASYRFGREKFHSTSAVNLEQDACSTE